MSSVSKPRRVLIHVQHLLGVGHLQRSLQLAAALAEHAFEVKLVSGGLPGTMLVPDGVQFHQLPPMYSADSSFTRMLDADGNAIDDAWRKRRKQQLLDLFNSFEPQVLITETFPFGRRMLRFELLPLLQAARESSSCLQVVASIRDILQPRSKPGRNIEVCEMIEQYYDHVLIHGDENIAQLADSFALASRVEDRLAYSGYICAGGQQLADSNDGNNEILVSAGGSATGLKILQSAIAAKPLCDLRDTRWRILVSPAIADKHFEKLRQQSDPEILVERNRPDFSKLLKRARLSISQAGYNTITDILDSDTPAIVIPFAEADEVEQTLRAQRLQDNGRCLMLAQKDLTADSLARAITSAFKGHTALAINLDGARNSAQLVSSWLAKAESEC